MKTKKNAKKSRKKHQRKKRKEKQNAMSEVRKQEYMGSKQQFEQGS